jgi:CHAD domain-containing protein
VTLGKHVRSHTSRLLQRLASQVHLAAGRSDEESVHDLRVAIRRLRECFRTFKDLYPEAPRKKVGKELRKVMKRAERVRSTDIALELLKKSGLDDSAELVRQMRAQRAQYRLALRDELRSLASRPYARSWSKALGL